MNKCPFYLLVFPALILSLTGCSNIQPKANPAYDYVAEGRGTWLSTKMETDWDSTMAVLSKAGFNMVFPFMCSAGSARYPSKILPMVGQRDELTLCLQAAHKYGIEVHALVVPWKLESGPDSVQKRMMEEGRTQFGYDGKPYSQVALQFGYRQNYETLCPSREDNRKLLYDYVMELAKNYDVDGINFDHFRFSFEPLCYCNNCKENFIKESGLKITKWPDDVWKDGPYREAYLDWRRELMISSVREITKAIHDYNPYICTSLCARRQLKVTYEIDAQEWWKWIREGLLDFVAPMDYSDEPEEYVHLIKQQFPLIKGALPYYGGVGVFRMKEFEPVKKAIELGRGIGEDGYVTFNINSLLPLLEQFKAAGVNSLPALLPHRAPETRFYVESSGRESEEGFKIFAPGSEVNFKVDVMFKAKLRQGISRIWGDVVLTKTSGEIVAKIKSFDLNEATIANLSVTCGEEGLYRLAFYGTMTLSNGDVRPFITKSFPFEISSS